MFSIPVSTGTSKVDKLLKMPSDSISEGVIFQNFLGGHAPRPPSAHTMSVNMLANPTSTMMTSLTCLVVSPPLSKV